MNWRDLTAVRRMNDAVQQGKLVCRKIDGTWWLYSSTHQPFCYDTGADAIDAMRRRLLLRPTMCAKSIAGHATQFHDTMDEPLP